MHTFFLGQELFSGRQFSIFMFFNHSVCSLDGLLINFSMIWDSAKERRRPHMDQESDYIYVLFSAGSVWKQMLMSSIICVFIIVF